MKSSNPKLGTSVKDEIKQIESSRNRQKSSAAVTLEAESTEKKAILDARARVLAAAEVTPDDGATLDIIEFQLAGERYGIESTWVKEVRPLRQLVPVPGTPPFVLGIVSVGGQVISVIDIKVFFDLPDKGLTELDKIVIVADGNMEFGLRADAVLGVRKIPLREIQASLPTLAGIRDRYLKGITKESVIILDIQKLFADESLIVND